MHFIVSMFLYSQKRNLMNFLSYFQAWLGSQTNIIHKNQIKNKKEICITKKKKKTEKLSACIMQITLRLGRGNLRVW